MKSKYKILIALSILFIILIPILYLILTPPTDQVHLSAIAVLRSSTGKSIFEATNITIDNVEDYYPPQENFGKIEEICDELGFDVTAKGAFAIIIRGLK
jgi:hypothetical protein